jgi:predicted CXXCH cytochrome family protein
MFSAQAEATVWISGLHKLIREVLWVLIGRGAAEAGIQSCPASARSTTECRWGSGSLQHLGLNHLIAVVAVGGLYLLFCVPAFSEPVHPLFRGDCTECHKDIDRTPRHHLELMSGSCIACHDPDQPARALSGALCLDCHYDIILLNAESVHPYVLSSDCQQCHFWHGADEPGILIGRSIAVCGACHPDHIGSRAHPVGDGIIDPTTGAEMTCVSSCHSPHMSTREGLLQEHFGQPLCSLCHSVQYGR